MVGHAESPLPRDTYLFGNCRIDLSARELRRAGKLVVLPPKVFDCLAYLIERHERAVGRDELVAAVWGRMEITNTLLGQTILKARRAIGDSADAQNAIRTIPRFGYAWVAALAADATDDKGSDPLAVVPPAAAPPATAFERRWIVLAVLAVMAGAGLWFARRPLPHDPARSGAASAAVLPVEVEAPADWSWVRLGLMDAIAMRLRSGDQATVPSDNVVALVSAAGSDGRDLDVRAASGAKFLILPSASWSSGGWDVHLELRGARAPWSADAHAADVLRAGRLAADRLLLQLGKQPPVAIADPRPASDDTLLQRAEAALLSNDLAAARGLLESAPAALRASPEVRLRLARIDFRAGQFDAADWRLRGLLKQAPAESDPVLRARILDGLGNVAMRLGNTDAADAAYAAAVALIGSRSEPAELGQAYMGRGIAAQTQGRYEDALADFSQARVAFELAGDGLALARIEANEGLLDAARERYAAAVDTLEHAAQRFQHFGAVNELTITGNAQIGAYLALLEPARALAASERAWTQRDRLGDARMRHALSVNRARALDATGRSSDAAALFEEVTRSADAERERTVLAVARSELARIELAAGHGERAAGLALAAVAALQPADDARDRLDAWRVAIRALHATAKLRDAAGHVDRLNRWAESTALPAAMLYSALANAEQRIATGRRSAAWGEYDRALELATQGGVPADIAEVAISYGAALLADAQLQRASSVIGHAARWADRDFGCALLQARLYAALGERQAWQNALAHARALAGDRAIPADASVLADASAAARRP